MDSFYASVEQMDNPKLKGKPVAVGGSKERGVVAAASYEARKYGVKSAMPSVIAKRKCKDLIFIKPRSDRYREISKNIRNIFYEYTDLVEPLSLDEAFLDVTKNKKEMPLANEIAREIRQKIKSEIGLTASAGISFNKFLAKVATEINKPNGQKTIHPKHADTFIENLKIEKFYGVGKITAKKMNSMGIYNGSDLKKMSLDNLKSKFGKSGIHFYNIVRNNQDNPVRPNRIRKSVGAERTFLKDIKTESFILDELDNIADILEKRLISSKNKGKTITVKIKYSDFKQQTRAKTVESYLQKKIDFFPIIEDLIYQEGINNSVRLLGISISNLKINRKEEKKDISVQLMFEF